MAYVREVDKLIRSLGSVPCGNATLHVEVRDYQGGGPKVALILRGERKNGGGPWENGLGRFPVAIAAELSRLVGLAATAGAAPAEPPKVEAPKVEPAAPALPQAIRPPKGKPVKAGRARVAA